MPSEKAKSTISILTSLKAKILGPYRPIQMKLVESFLSILVNFGLILNFWCFVDRLLACELEGSSPVHLFQKLGKQLLTDLGVHGLLVLWKKIGRLLGCWKFSCSLSFPRPLNWKAGSKQGKMLRQIGIKNKLCWLVPGETRNIAEMECLQKKVSQLIFVLCIYTFLELNFIGFLINGWAAVQLQAYWTYCTGTEQDVHKPNMSTTTGLVVI